MCVWNRMLLWQGRVDRGWRDRKGPTEEAGAATRETTVASTTYTVVEDTEREASKIKRAADGLEWPEGGG